MTQASRASSKTVSSIRIGEILIKSGVLAAADLDEAIGVAGETGLPIGRVLIMSGYLDDKTMQAAVYAQSLIRDGLLELEIAFKALKSVAESGVSMDEALAGLKWQPRKEDTGNRLGGLLVGAGLISREKLDEALRSSAETGLPLGRILVSTGVMSEQLLSAVLTAQVMLRDKKVTREQALQGIKSAAKRRVTLEQSLRDHGYYRLPTKQHVRLGELFVLAGVLSESDLMNVLEIGLLNEQPIGRVLVQSGYINNRLLECALKLQEMVQNGTLSPLQAAEALGRVRSKGISIAQAVAEIGAMKSAPHETIRLGELLKVAGFITQGEIDTALDLSAKNSSLIGKMLLVTGMIDEPTLHAALRCQFLIREDFLKMDQAIIALNYCQRSKVSLDDAMRELGWTVPSSGPVKPEQDS